MHVTQVARLLDLPAPGLPGRLSVAHDVSLLLASWAHMLQPLPKDVITAPTASRGRSLRNLTMNAVYPISMLPDAHATGRFGWGLADEDEQRAASYKDGAALAAFTDTVGAGWLAYVTAHSDELESNDNWVEAARGRMRFSELLAHQRWHLSFHHRQVVRHLETLGRNVAIDRTISQSLDLGIADDDVF